MGMPWAPGIPAPATLWPVGTRISAKNADGVAFTGQVTKHATLYSVQVDIDGKRSALVPTSLIDGAAEMLANHLADLALG